MHVELKGEALTKEEQLTVDRIAEDVKALKAVANGRYLLLCPADGRVAFLDARDLEREEETARERLRLTDLLLQSTIRRLSEARKQSN